MGTAIFIKGSFTGEVLPDVIVEKAKTNEQLAKEYASRYSTATGVTYRNGDIKTMCLSLLNEGLWDDILMLCPIFGETEQSLCANIRDLTKPIIVGGNASASTNKLSFDNKKAFGNEIKHNIANTFHVESEKGLTVFAYLKRTGSYNSSKLYDTIDNSFEKINSLSIGTRAGGSGALCSFGNNYAGQTIDAKTAACRCFCIDSELHPHIIEEGRDIKYDVVQSDSIIKIPRIFGTSVEGMTGEAGSTLPDASTDIFGGEVYMFAVGVFDTFEKQKKFEEIVRTFVVVI